MKTETKICTCAGQAARKSGGEISPNREKIREFELKDCALFTGIGQTETEQLLRCLRGRRRAFNQGEILLAAGEPVREIGILLRGSAQVVREDFWGNRSILSPLEPGELFAESFACTGESAAVSVVANERSEALYLDAEKLRNPCPAACGFHGRLISNLLSVAAEKNLRLTRKIEHLSKRTTREKLLSYLSEQSKGRDYFEIPFDRQALADYLSVERSAMCAELSRMRADGLLDFELRRFRLLHR